MTKRIPMKGGDEYDGLTKARRFLHWKAGQLKKIKRAYNKRFRKQNKEKTDDCSQRGSTGRWARLRYNSY